jgi:hypothetical protein
VDEYIDSANQARFIAAAEDLSEQATESNEAAADKRAETPKRSNVSPQWAIGNRFAALANEDEEVEADNDSYHLAHPNDDNANEPFGTTIVNPTEPTVHDEQRSNDSESEPPELLRLSHSDDEDDGDEMESPSATNRLAAELSNRNLSEAVPPELLQSTRDDDEELIADDDGDTMEPPLIRTPKTPSVSPLLLHSLRLDGNNNSNGR